VRIQEIPITAEKVHRALELRARGRGARFGPRAFPEVPYPAFTRVEPPPGSPSPVRCTAGPV